MARTTKKSSLDMEEPVLVEGEETIVSEPIADKAVDKVVETTVTEKENTKQKAETQGKNKKRGVKICVF